MPPLRTYNRSCMVMESNNFTSSNGRVPSQLCSHEEYQLCLRQSQRGAASQRRESDVIGFWFRYFEHARQCDGCQLDYCKKAKRVSTCYILLR